ncbi:MAG: HAD family phosphatase [Lachnospiraceae bacterium]|nr:HAD family phosphatase [Lachnospiraceae bacterium]
MSLEKFFNLFPETKAVLFDMDGTVIDSMWMWSSIDREFLERTGKVYDPHFQKEIEGLSYRETVAYFKERFHVEEDLTQLAETLNNMAMYNYEKVVKFKPGAHDFLMELKAIGIKTGIATSNSAELVAACDRNLNLRGIFDTIRTTDMVERSKPFPDVYLLAARDISIAPENCVVFEDIIPGLMAGRNAGMRIVAVQDDYSMDVDQQKREMADYYIRDYKELIGA